LRKFVIFGVARILIARTQSAEVAQNGKRLKEVARIKMPEQLCASDDFARIIMEFERI